MISILYNKGGGQLGGLCLLFIPTVVGMSVLLWPGEAHSQVSSSLPVELNGFYLLKSVLALCFVVGVIFLLSKALRFVGNSGNVTPGTLKVLGGVSLGSREKLVIVQAGDTQLLLGIGPAGIVKLEKFDSPIDTEVDSTQQGFKAQLTDVLRKTKN